VNLGAGVVIWDFMNKLRDILLEIK